MSLNQKRRIFRPGSGLRPLRALGVVLAACGAAATVFATGSFLFRSMDAPAQARAGMADGLHLSASLDGVLVLDGETLRVGGQLVQLRGVAAPARGSVCRGADPDCGSAAANALASLVRDRVVDCEISGHDGRGRRIGNCLVAGKRLSEALVLNGWARAEDADLRDAEAAARGAGRGIWRAGS